MKQRKSRIFVGDFETTVFKGQERTDVWASGCCELFTEDAKIFHSIDEQFEYFLSLKSSIICYYHNLKFDGAFWLYYLMVNRQYEQAVIKTGESIEDIQFAKVSEMKNKSFTYSISSMGQWYRIIIKVNNYIIEFRDSLKLLPFSVKKIGESFGTKHKKSTMEYTGFRYPGCEITKEEKEYLKNDLFVIKEAVEIMYTEGHNKLTIGSCCLSEYKSTLGNFNFSRYFPNVYDIKIDAEKHGVDDAGIWIKQSYHGGWCYLVRGKENRLYHNGITLDVNSLYPSVMSSISGNYYPVGVPTFWTGNYIPEEAKQFDKYFFVRFRTRFYIKKGKLPFIQIKNNLMYKSTEMLETSAIKSKVDGKYHEQYYNTFGELKEAIVELTMTCTDYKLFREHYDVKDFEILDGCYFDAAVGIFDEYIEKYKQIKITSKGAQRELAKLFLNNLYGKMATSKNSSFKIAYIKDDRLAYYIVHADDKKPGYIPVGSAITSYARNFTIRTAQLNYHGKDKPGFIYADTDSIHCDLPMREIKGIETSDTDFCKWKLESEWETGLFVRQKTYVEVENNNGKLTHTVKCAGMPERCKELFIASIGGSPDEYEMLADANGKINYNDLSEEEAAYLRESKELTDFGIGLRIPGKLVPRNIPGGVLLTETTYEMR